MSIDVPPPTRRVAAGDLDVAFTDLGDGPPFVLVHGFTGSRLDFQNQAPWFADVRRVIAPDGRGHGDTRTSAASGPDSPYHLDQLVEDLAQFLNALDLMRVDLLGHSLGGMVAMRFALEYPDRVRSLVLMDTSPEPMEITNATIRKQIADKVRAEGCAALVPMMKLQPQDAPRQRGVDFLGEAEHWRRITEKLERMDPEAFVTLSEVLGAHDAVTDRLHEIVCPTTVLVGQHDTPFIEPARTLAARIGGAALTTIKHAAHSPQYENHEDWRAAIATHLAR